MNSIRKIFGFLAAALMLGAIAQSAIADHGDETFTLVMAPASVSGGPQTVTATLTSQVGDDDRIKSFRIITPPGVTPLSVTSTSPAISSSNIQIVQATATAAGSVSVKNVNVGRYNRTIVMTLAVTFPPASCAAKPYAWTAKAWEDSNYSSGQFAGPAAGSQLTTTVGAGSCNYSLTGDTSVVAGSSSNVLNMTLTNNATAGGPAITAITLTPPPGITITDASGGAFSGLNVLANGGTATLSVTVKSDNPSCVLTPEASWGVSAITPGNFVIYPPGSYPKTTITAQSCAVTLQPLPTSAVKGAAFSQVVDLTNGPGNASVTLTATGSSCPALTGTTTKTATPNATGGSVTFDGLSFAATGSCTLTATATLNYPPSSAKNFDIFAAGGLACNSATYPTSAGDGVLNGPLDPNADSAYVGGADVSWGLRRGDNVSGDSCTGNPVNYTLTISDDKKISNLLYDKGNGQGFASFKYVLVWPGTVVVGWPSYQPDVAWVTIDGVPQYVPGLACLNDDLSSPGTIMPTLPNVFPFAGNLITDYQYGIDPSTGQLRKAKMCIAQVGWTPVSGLIFYWTKVVDQSDGFVHGP